MKTQFVLLGAAIAAGLFFAIVGTISVANSAAQTGYGSQGQGKGNMTMAGGPEDNEKPSFIYKLNNKYRDYENGVFKVRTGNGGHVAPLTMFFPKHAEIKVGETVVFYNPTSVQEPHTVTFIMDNSTFADFVAPYVVENGTSFSSPAPNSNSEPILVPGPGGKNMILGLNNRSFSPTVIDSDGKVTYLPPNANYTVSGTEKYINSGWIWPKDQAPQGIPPIDSFSLTFAKEGTYNYMCVVHPWMSGDVVVK